MLSTDMPGILNRVTNIAGVNPLPNTSAPKKSIVDLANAQIMFTHREGLLVQLPENVICDCLTQVVLVNVRRHFCHDPLLGPACITFGMDRDIALDATELVPPQPRMIGCCVVSGGSKTLCVFVASLGLLNPCPGLFILSNRLVRLML